MKCPSCHIEEGTFYRIEWMQAGTRQKSVSGKGWSKINSNGCSMCTGGVKPIKYKYSNGNEIYFLHPPDAGVDEQNPKYK